MKINWEKEIAKIINFGIDLGFIWFIALWANPNLDSGIIWLVAFIYASTMSQLNRLYSK